MSLFDATPNPDPYAVFGEWLAAAEQQEPNDPNAMALATVSADGMPSVRMLLMKNFDQRGFAFYTNCNSRKGSQLEAHPKAAICFHWKSMRRQVRAEGPVVRTSDAESDDYFASRTRGSQIAAWASDQSQPLASREQLLAKAQELEKKFADQPVPRPPHWSGFRLTPVLIEFWQDQRFRLHDRIQYVFEQGGWKTVRLNP